LLAACAHRASGGSAAGAWPADCDLVSPIHEAQVVRGDDGKDHVEYELLVVNAVEQPVTLMSLTVLDPAAKELTRIDGPVLVAATRPSWTKSRWRRSPRRRRSRSTSI
jgi:hypothetical protein